MINLYNSLTRKKEEFKPVKAGEVSIYTCGPTVYWYAHVGNLRTYIFEDVLKRVLIYAGYKVNHVMNITDVGHLTSDEDTGEDKMEKGAKRENKTVWDIAQMYTDAFQKDLATLNIIEPDVWVKATDTIPGQIELIKKLEAKGFTYVIADGVYFDTAKLKEYGRLWPNKMDIKAGARVEMVEGKKNDRDFALWKFTPSGVKRQMEWDSPWGKGFPGWHTECVVMSCDNLGIPFDIHCGGIDHVLIHHTNELAQAEAAYGKQMCNFWMHGDYLNLKGEKIAKSSGNIVLVGDLAKRNIDPLAYRYLCFTTHYRIPLSFSWESIEAADNALKTLYEKVRAMKAAGITAVSLKSREAEAYREKFEAGIYDDLNMPKALAVLWEAVKDSKLSESEKLALMIDFDRVFGFKFDAVETIDIPAEISELVRLREAARQAKDWSKSDEYRQQIEKLGYSVEDTAAGPKIKKI
ncbi:MAG TPA: cysteine--tRNA ligase [Candidatus Paceibacterota bacterium]|nr:cysteine--tRNA ligase [Candidatus Pacearchaeota archaeon]HRZ51471.1 cysteine--tRNA ligase [Candidatus Paceibacterota bacterium]HSA37227.1 cysteine--tRNA ligase [Candidatus Paceibacterota bacterium]